MLNFSARSASRFTFASVPRNFKKSRCSARSFHFVNTFYHRGSGSDRHFSSAVKSIDELLQEAESGNVDSITEVGKYYLDKGDHDARKWLKLACDLGHSEASFLLGVMLVENPSSDMDEVPSSANEDPENSAESRRNAVLKEIKDATQTARTARKINIQLKRKKALATSGNVDEKITNYELGLEYLRTSCRQNNGRALCYLGNILLSKDTNDDVTEAMLLYEKAANLIPGQRDALFNLGSLFYHGRDGMLDVNLKKSFEYYKRAADLGDISSAFWVGYSYAIGENGACDELKNMSINPQLALKYLLLCDAADHGHGLFILSTLYRSGLKATDSNGDIIQCYEHNIEPCKDLFIKYLMRSVELDDSSGLNTLARLYLNLSESEDYFPKDEVKGIDLLNRASTGGDAEVHHLNYFATLLLVCIVMTCGITLVLSFITFYTNHTLLLIIRYSIGFLHSRCDSLQCILWDGKRSAKSF